MLVLVLAGSGCAMVAGGGLASDGARATQAGVHIGGTGEHHVGAMVSGTYRSIEGDAAGLFALSGAWSSSDPDATVEPGEGVPGVHARAGFRMVVDDADSFHGGPTAAFGYHGKSCWLIELEYGYTFETGIHDAYVLIGFDAITYVASHIVSL